MKRKILAGALAGILLTAGLALIIGCATEPRRGRAINLETEIVVVGGGGAGFSAALTAREAGREVIVIEKLSLVGGNTLIAGSAANAANPELQRRKTMSASEIASIRNILALPPHDSYMRRWQENVRRDFEAHQARGATYIFDSPELHKLHTYIGGDFVANPRLVEIFGSNALDSIHWLASLGAGWSDDISAAVGAMWTRSHMPTFNFGPQGSNFVLPQERRFTQLGGRTYLEHRAEKIIMEGGRAVGVAGTTSGGTPFTVRASMGVILATGGFSSNVEMRERYNRFWPTLAAHIPSSNIDAAQGDGILMADAIGANLIDMEWIQLLPINWQIFLTASISNTIYVNRYGDRFIHEDGRRDDLSSAILRQPNGLFWLIYDTQTVDQLLGGVTTSGRDVRSLVDNRALFMADTIEDLARQKGADPVRFRRAVDDFNAAVAGAPDPFGRNVFEWPINQPPFFAVRGTVYVHHTMGGVEINEYCQVLDRNGRIIPGLFAAGEVVGGIHGANRLGANAITDILVFGRIAGASAAAGR